MSQKLPIPSKEELENDYVSVSALARKYNTSNPTVRKWLKVHGIPIKNHATVHSELIQRNKTKEFSSKETLEKDYSIMSIKDMERKYNVSQATIYQWLEIREIEIKSLSEACQNAKQRQFSDIQFSKKEILNSYIKNKNINLAANDLGISSSHFRKQMRNYDIKGNISWRSQGETELFNFCKSLDINWTNNDKTLINPFELDMVNHERKLAIEFCGLYWHSETYGKKSKSYHQHKYNMCQQKGYQLITVFETDDRSKIESLIRTKHGLNERIFARKCDIVIVSSNEAMRFHGEHHLSNGRGGKIHYGLKYNNELVMVISFGQSRFNKEIDWECVRMTSHSKYSVIGGASKLWKKFFDDHPNESCLTYADLRYGNGSTYNNCGLNYKGNTNPNYWYFLKNKPFKLFSRIQFQKHKLQDKLSTFDSALNEYENMLANGYDRIWDCGNAIYIKKTG